MKTSGSFAIKKNKKIEMKTAHFLEPTKPNFSTLFVIVKVCVNDGIYQFNINFFQKFLPQCIGLSCKISFVMFVLV